MDTPTRERIEALEERIKTLEIEVAELRSKVGAVSSGPSFEQIKQEISDQVSRSKPMAFGRLER